MKKETKLQVGDIVRFSTNPSEEDVDPLGNDMFRGPTVGDKQKLVLTQILEKIEEQEHNV
jgi:hypothetical protein